MTKIQNIEKLVEQTNETGKSMESNIKYQLITIALFFGYITKAYSANEIKILGAEIPFSVLELVCPIILLYLLAKIGVLTISFIDSGVVYFKEVEENNYSRAFRPRSIFVSILLSKYGLDDQGKSFHTIFTSILYVIPGINLGLTFFAIWNYQAGVFRFMFFILALVIIIGVTYDFWVGKSSKDYKLIPVTYLVMMIIVFCSLIF